MRRWPKAGTADGFRHAGLGYREFVVPARVVNRYERRLYTEDAEVSADPAATS